MREVPADVAVSAARIRQWREHPQSFHLDNFGVRMEDDPWQDEACTYLGSTEIIKRLELVASAGVGKSCLEAMEGWRRLACYGSLGEYPRGFAISKSRENLRDGVWAELRKWGARSEFLKRAFTQTADQITSNHAPGDWFLSARGFAQTASGEQQAAALSGLHSDYPFMIIDESASIHPTVKDRAEQAMSTAKDGLIITSGNPADTSGMLYDIYANFKDLWRIIEITSDPDDPNRSKRVKADWARQQIEAATDGRDDPWIQVYILGKFPDQAINQLLTLEEVNAAMSRNVKAADYEWAGKALGVDVAGEGLDSSVIFPRQGLVAFEPVARRGVNNIDGAAWVGRMAQDWQADSIFVDNTGGFGAGWVSQLGVLGFSPTPVEFSGRSTDPQFFNKRAEMYWRMREWVIGGGALPQCKELIRELTVPTYTHKRDKLIIEPKERIKEKLKGRSPDHADALALTFAFDVGPNFARGSIAEGLQDKTSFAKMDEEPEW